MTVGQTAVADGVDERGDEDGQSPETGRKEKNNEDQPQCVAKECGAMVLEREDDGHGRGDEHKSAVRNSISSISL